MVSRAWRNTYVWATTACVCFVLFVISYRKNLLAKNISEYNTGILQPFDRFFPSYNECSSKQEKNSGERDYFENALVYGHKKNKTAFLTIGIPSMHRPQNKTYLWQTLDSLLVNSKEHERKDMTVVILLSDFDQDLKRSHGQAIVERYGEHIRDGLIQVIEAPREYYPSLENLTRTYQHRMEQVKWRSKQNIDYAFMMRYSQNLSNFYLQLEDDVTTVPGYYEIIKDFIAQNNKTRWVCLEFSSLGFIAKLYHSYHLPRLANLLTAFYAEQPNDEIYLYFNRLLTQFRRKIRMPTIFQHHGYHSTLVIKKEWRKDKFFDKSA